MLVGQVLSVKSIENVSSKKKSIVSANVIMLFIIAPRLSDTESGKGHKVYCTKVLSS